MIRVAYIRTTNIYDDSRATKEITALLEAGFSVSVFGWNRDGKAVEECNKSFGEKYGNIEYYFFNRTINGGIGIKNINLLLDWMKWLKKTIKSCAVFDVIHACNLDSTFGMLKYCKKNHSRLIYDIYDYYIDSHNIPSVLVNIIEKAEIKVINNADAVIICTEERRAQISKAKPKKLLVIHNSPDISKINDVDICYDYTYCGALFDKRLINEIFLSYKDNSSLSFAIAGYGKYTELALDLAKNYGSFNYFGAIPYAEVLKIESQARVISAIYEPTIRNHRLCAPNKFYEALALGKPLIVCRGTGIDKIVEDNNIGIVIDYDADRFYEALNYLVLHTEECKEMGERARKLYEDKYNWGIMKNILTTAYDELNS